MVLPPTDGPAKILVREGDVAVADVTGRVLFGARGPTTHKAIKRLLKFVDARLAEIEKDKQQESSDA